MEKHDRHKQHPEQFLLIEKNRSFGHCPMSKLGRTPWLIAFDLFLQVYVSTTNSLLLCVLGIIVNKSERPVDALAIKNINHSLTDSLT